jgi:hypothetical protein
MLRYYDLLMMNGKMILAMALSGITTGTAVFGAEPAATPPPASPQGPKIQFETTTHDLGKAMQGEKIKYTYVFTNTGDQVLEISGVHACGCITIGDFTKKVEPDKTGSIPISFNSSGYNGTVNKSINVTCNDKNNAHPMLQFTATIWKGLDIEPQFVILNVQPDAPQTSTTVRIVNNTPEPLHLSAPESDNQAFTAQLKTVQPDKEFQVVISASPPFSARNLQGHITLKSSLASMPVINLTVYANVAPAVEVNPARIGLPPTPLTNEVKSKVSIVNRSAKALVLSEPTINAKGVRVELNEVQAGRMFEATLTFPAGFELTHSEVVELSIKSNVGSVPVVKVPVFQAPHRLVRSATMTMTPGGPAPRLPVMAPQPGAAPASARQ